MSNVDLLILKRICQILVIGISFYKWNRLGLFLRLISVQVFVSLVIDMLAWTAIYKLGWKNNFTIYNVYMPIEAGLLLGAAWRYVTPARERRLLLMSAALFGLCWLFCIVRHFQQLANYALVCENMLLIGWYLYVLYYAVIADGIHTCNAVLWVCIGIVFYAGCMVPYVSLTQYLLRDYPAINTKLFIIVSVCEKLRYVFTGIALLVSRPQLKPRHLSTNG